MTWIRRVGSWVALAAVLVGLVGAPAGGQEAPAEELDEARRGYDEALAEEEAILVEYEAATSRVAELGAQADELDARVTAAEAEVAAAQVVLDESLAALADAQARSDAAVADLTEAREVLRAQAVAAYVGGMEPMAAAGAMLRADGLGELEKSRTYADVVIARQRDAVDRYRVAELRAQEEADTRDAARSEAESVRAAVADRAAELATARSALAEVQAEADDQAALQQSLLAEVQSRRGAYEQRVAELEAESARIEALLREQALARANTAPTGPGAAPAPSGGGEAALGDPLDTMVVTSGFGYRTHPIYGTRRLHAGIDLDGDTGDPVFAAAAGTVVSAGAQGGYGSCVIVDHGSGLATLYAHLSSISVTAGASVAAGQRVGAVGSTGASTGPHLHFEVREDGTPVNPVPYLS